MAAKKKKTEEQLLRERTAREAAGERFMDRSVPAQCNTCAHNNFDGSCKAYKNGIPIVILSNQLDHRQPIQGDNGYLWSLADDAPYSEHPNDRAFFEKYIFPDTGPLPSSPDEDE